MSDKYDEYAQRFETLGKEYMQKWLELSQEYIAKNQVVMDDAKANLESYEQEFYSLNNASYTGFIVQLMEEFHQED